MEHSKETEIIRELYNNSEHAWPTDDPWHKETKLILKQIVEHILLTKCTSDDTVLNAGCGGTTYDFPGVFYDCDIAENTISQSAHPIIASIEKLPCENNYFDISICVGSVLNYCDAGVAIAELSRTLKPQGLLVLEFERSDSAEFLFTKRHHQSAFQKDYFYNGQIHRLWLYSEKHIRRTLKAEKLEVIKAYRYHSLSSLLYRFTGNEGTCAKYIKQDWIVRPLCYHFAHNVILLCKKITASYI